MCWFEEDKLRINEMDAGMGAEEAKIEFRNDCKTQLSKAESGAKAHGYTKSI